VQEDVDLELLIGAMLLAEARRSGDS
jgi:hypothetical protein